MILTKELAVELSHFITPAGDEALQKLTKAIYEHYTKQMVLSSGDDVLIYQGGARVADLLKTLSRGLREYGNATSTST